MKFGKHLKEEMPMDWRFNFIDYTGLKKFLKTNVATTSWDDSLETKFVHMLEEELKKVSDFGFVKYNELNRHVQFLESDLTKQMARQMSENAKDDIKQELGEVTVDITKLAKYNSLNYTGFLKILKKHDKVTKYCLKPSFLARLTRQPFYKETFDTLILKLSTMFEKLKPADREGVKGTVNHSAFVRKTTKYWVHPDNITDVKCIILQHLPVLVFKTDPRFEKGYDAAITSIYYDNDQHQLYQERIEKTQHALAIRLRWYGTTPSEVFVERKTHHEDWTGEKSVKERFMLKEKYVNEYLKGNYDFNAREKQMRDAGKSDMDIEYTISLAKEIQQQVLARKLHPSVRTFYNRTAFQHPTSQEVRISLDTELTMVKERNKTNGMWYRKDVGVDFPFSYVEADEIERFPYAVLEVKLATQAGAEPPKWITDLINSHLVEVVPKFSKFIHGTASLMEERVKLLPFWLPQMEKDIRKKPKHPKSEKSAIEYARGSLNNSSTSASVDNRGVSGRRRNSINYATVNGVDTDGNYTDGDDLSVDENTSLLRKRKKHNITVLDKLRRVNEDALTMDKAGPDRSKTILIPARVEPKVFFANERTFLNWLHTSTMISTIGLALLNLSPNESSAKGAKLAGITLIPVAILFLGYALYLYFWRDQMIRNREQKPYNTIAGPVAITTVFMICLIVNYVLFFVENGTSLNSWGANGDCECPAS
eukprot:CFRG2653T1